MMMTQIKLITLLFSLILLVECKKPTEQNFKRSNKKSQNTDKHSVEKNDLQEIKIKELSQQQIDEILNSTTKEKLGIDNFIQKVFKYQDKSGTGCLITTHNNIKKNKTKSIKAYILSLDNNNLVISQEIKDSVLPNGNDVSEELSISFWHKYLSLEDYDKDGYVDLIVVYGTKGLNGLEDGRMKLLIYHKDSKIAIRHQNSILDDERHTEIDDSYESLPNSIKKAVKNKVLLMIEKKHALFNSVTMKKLDS